FYRRGQPAGLRYRFDGGRRVSASRPRPVCGRGEDLCPLPEHHRRPSVALSFLDAFSGQPGKVIAIPSLTPTFPPRSTRGGVFFARCSAPAGKGAHATKANRGAATLECVAGTPRPRQEWRGSQRFA